MNAFKNIYKDKIVLVTGHTGFKGSWLSIWLNELGAKVIGYALDPYSNKDNFVLSDIGSKIVDIRADINDYETLHGVFKKYEPDFVFHLAAQPLVKESYNTPVETYQTNVIGTINVLEAMRSNTKKQVGIMITTDKCYDNKEQIWGYRESDPLGGYDPYSSSKGAAEIAIKSWRLSFMNPENYKSHFKSVASVRAGNVIGGGDWAKDRIIPDCIRALETDKEIELRNPNAIRPWQHVLEPLYGYLLLGQKLYTDPQKYAESWNFGPDDSAVTNVKEIAEMIIKKYKKGTIKMQKKNNILHEAQLLALDITKAKIKLKWYPTLSIEQAIDWTTDWYLNYENRNIYNLCVNQICSFIELQNRK